MLTGKVMATASIFLPMVIPRNLKAGVQWKGSPNQHLGQKHLEVESSCAPFPHPRSAGEDLQIGTSGSWL